MTAPDRIWACRDADTSESYWAAPGEIYQTSHLVGEFIRADGPIIKAWRAALELHDLDPDSIAREAEKEAQNG